MQRLFKGPKFTTERKFKDSFGISSLGVKNSKKLSAARYILPFFVGTERSGADREYAPMQCIYYTDLNDEADEVLE